MQTSTFYKPLEIRAFLFWYVLLSVESAEGSLAFHHVIAGLCYDIQYSAPLLNHPGSITSETRVPRSAFTVLCSRAFSFLL